MLLLMMAANAVAQDQKPTLEERVAELERRQRLEQLGVKPQEAAFTASWVSVDTAGVPDLQDSPKAPGVASTVDLKLWGRVNFAAGYDNFQGTGGIGGADFTNFITAEGNEEVNFNARDTRFGFAASNSWDDWTGRAVFEIDFYGDTSTSNLQPRLRLGYVELQEKQGFSLRAGQDWIPIAQQNPGMIDYGILAFSGNLFNRVPQITARYKMEKGEALLGLVHNRVQNAQDQQERMPWIMARYAYTGLMDNKGLLALGGGVRDATISNAAGNVSVTNYVGAAEAKLPVCPQATIIAEGWIGSGIGREFTRSGLDYNSLGEEMEGAGGFVSLEWKPADKWQFNVGYGIDQPKDDDTTTATFYGASVPYDANRTLFANARYQLSKQAGIGVEVCDIQTELVDGVTSGNDGQNLRGQRVTFGTWFIF